MKKIKLGIDIGSVSLKLAAEISDYQNLEHDTNPGRFFPEGAETKNGKIIATEPIRIHGRPVEAARDVLEKAVNILDSYCKNEQVSYTIAVTGSQGRRIAALLEAPYINEFRAISRGIVEIEPETSTVLEIGGDRSRFLNIAYDDQKDQVSIMSYDHNGDCAAGTGSFIDQQAERLKYKVEELSELVQSTEKSAVIAGRCSVFAKSDMIHAQQRGFSNAEIIRGLCKAVVKNYHGTVLRGKHLHEKVAFIGGLAKNDGIVSLLREELDMDENCLVVPNLHTHIGAIGSTILPTEKLFNKKDISKLDSQKKVDTGDDDFKVDMGHVCMGSSEVEKHSEEKSRILSLDNVYYPSTSEMSSKKKNYPIDAFLGVDIGSVSTNFVLLDNDGFVIDEIYTRTQGDPVGVAMKNFANWHKKWTGKVNIIGCATTGSGRELVGELIGADVVQEEITAHKTGADYVANLLALPAVDTIFEIGGQDSKFISLEDGIVIDFTMNEACAAGTGSFLEEQAHKMGISIKGDFANLALSAEDPVRMGERCTVFMEKDVTAYLRSGKSLENICAGLSHAVVSNYLNRVVRERKVGDAIFFQGGTAYNKAVAAAFASSTGKQITVPPFNGIMGAIGSALLAKRKYEALNYKTRFRSFDLSGVNFTIKHFVCNGCSNLCEIQQVTVDGEKTFWGDKCTTKFRKKKVVDNKAIIDDLIAFYQKNLIGKPVEGSGLKNAPKIGYPRSLYFYDRYPFFREYFRHIGAELVLSPPTNRKIVSLGRQLCISEPCFPILAAHGHFNYLLEQDLDYIFNPVITNSETPFPDKESWMCPWGETLPLVIMNALENQQDRDIMLRPFIRFRDGKSQLKKQLHPMAKKLGISKSQSDDAVEAAYRAMSLFKELILKKGREELSKIEAEGEKAIILLGRPYNIFDGDINLNIPTKLRESYGMNVIPLQFLDIDHIDISDIHGNMFWNYGRKILQASRFASKNDYLSIIYITNFKCGPDSYIKHFVRKTLGNPYLTLQFDDHSNDAGIITRCEAYLESKNLL
ncbi:MAG: acyl-CoA dehydratase activase [Candidatus Zixiibacteriota bacterium]